MSVIKQNIFNRDYLDIYYEIESLRALGFADGLADFVSDAEKIAIHSYKLNKSKGFVLECTMAYMEGYSVGSFMSENCEELYDEDGNLKSEYDIESNIYERDVLDVIKRALKNSKY